MFRRKSDEKTLFQSAFFIQLLPMQCLHISLFAYLFCELQANLFCCSKKKKRKKGLNKLEYTILYL